MTTEIGGIYGGIDAVLETENSYNSSSYDVNQDSLPLRHLACTFPRLIR